MAVLWAFVGFALHLHIAGKLSFALTPAIACAGLSVLLTLAGIWGLLPFVSWVLYILGWGLAAYYAFTQRKKWKSLFCASNVFVVAACLYACLRLDGLVLRHYDNYSHWALIVQQMLRTDALPSLETPLILFTSYPPGSACFIYFFAKLAGPMESVWAVAQAFWLACCMAPFFAFVDKSKSLGPGKATACGAAMGYALIVLSYIAMLITNIFINELLVDTLLPLVALSGVAVALALKDQPQRMAFAVAPIGAALMLIKNSGAFFALLLLALVLWLTAQKQDKRRTLYTALGFLAMIIVTQLLWQGHVSRAFPAVATEAAGATVATGAAQAVGTTVATGATGTTGAASAASAGGKHSLSLAAYAQSFISKAQSGVLWQATKNFVRTAIDLSQLSTQLMLALGLLGIGLGLVYPSSRKALWALLGIAALWQLSLLGMYLFSASEREALAVSGYNRYTLTMGVFALGVFVLLQLRWINQWSVRPRAGQGDQAGQGARAGQGTQAGRSLLGLSLVLALALCPLFISRGTVRILWQDINTLDRRPALQSLQDTCQLPEGQQLLVYVEAFQDAGYTSYISRYVFQTPAITMVDGSSYREGMPKHLAESDGVLFADPNEEALAFARALCQEQGLDVPIYIAGLPTEGRP